MRWDGYAARLEASGKDSPSLLKRAREVARRAAAIDTGAIEGLYEVDRGFTITVATQAAMWDAVLSRKGEQVRALIESQLDAYEYVMDLATEKTPVAEAWIRQLHSRICQGQDTFQAFTEVGIQQQPLPKGEYKRLPNHVLRRDGKIHSNAPVDLTPAEMHRLCEELRSEAFMAAHPMLQASYAHYALVAVHPFADGNGRVARALASVYTYRAQSVPVLVLAENRAEYFSALSEADEGRFQLFVDFMLERALDAMELVQETLIAAAGPQVPDELAALRKLYVTKGGYTHADVDAGAYRLMEALQQEATRRTQQYQVDKQLLFGINPNQEVSHQPAQDSPYRLPVTNGVRWVNVACIAAEPAAARVDLRFTVEVPKDCGRRDGVVIRNMYNGHTFEARATEVIPALTAGVQMRLSIFVEREFGVAFAKLREDAANVLKSKGYS